MTADNKMLIFKNADDDTAMVPLSRLKSINGGTGALVLTFDAEADVDAITLTCDADEFKAAKALVAGFNKTGTDGAIVIADDVAGVYITDLISGVTIA